MLKLVMHGQGKFVVQELKREQMGFKCSFCKEATLATHRLNNWDGKFACNVHLTELYNAEKERGLPEERTTLQELNTWRRL